MQPKCPMQAEAVTMIPVVSLSLFVSMGHECVNIWGNEQYPVGQHSM